MMNKKNIKNFAKYFTGIIVFVITTLIINILSVNYFSNTKYIELYTNLLILFGLCIILKVLFSDIKYRIRLNTYKFYIVLLSSAFIIFLFNTAILVLYGTFDRNIEICFKGVNTSILFSFLYFLIVAIKEELFFRFYLVETISTLTRNVVLVGIVTSIAFLINHVPGNVFSLTNIFLWGLFYYYIYNMHKKIEINIGIHLGYNLSISTGMIFNIGFKSGYALILENLIILSFLTFASRKARIKEFINY